ncbi:N-acetyl-gamma-glutamyl-phosphate reductase [Sphingomonas sp. ABOLD]|uniref:N-acetyl-gamma-glutamyl-phosphate reductase n=1 Tax=Sphingomonas trueperi TaxID=53317 RepID=A0A7X5XYP3_9SPHN|nr:MULTISPECIES: N-acetyl-gamma-glutamyl-phosphate reductase [Sphingomonas]NJB97497.1 N-acetyl-gamma-glutamyl-phosphate reductase [Sphingomonas trueperi]RSV41593.1 N-acetyl-gamma-glutamyl-phosphate reductase [Sphingomonas sp. ABOLD]RSV43195.1 N-acetyl-gamma-glutamyl-phosphate reductase [Sphingomonas sp. ABOLE]
MIAHVFIDGAAGTTGLEIRERLAGRAEIEVMVLDDQDRKDPKKRAQALNAADFVILCLPDDAAREAVAMIENERTRVIDASTAYRTAADWTYGFAELEPGQAAAIAEAARVSNPGCYPTGFLALVRPLIRAGLIPHDFPLSVNAVSGYSGGGRAMIAEFEGDGPEATATAFRPYGLSLAHKHVPEMQKHARIEHPPIFLPSVARTYRGMIVEVPLPLFAFTRKPSVEALENVLRDAYRDSPVVQVLPADVPTVSIEENAGTDRLSVRVFGNDETRQARLIATLDNLGKGAAGAAVQNLNIMAGLDPTAGLVL